MQARLGCARTTLPVITAVAVAIASSVVLTLGGCASTGGLTPSATPIAPASIGLDPAAASANAASANATPAIETEWWRHFGDAALNDIVARAIAGNPSLKTAQARLERAQAVIESNRANQGLKVDGQATASRQLFSANTIYPPPFGGNAFSLGQLQLNASYQFDFFGRNRAAIEAAVGQQRAAQADVQAARIALAVNATRTYVQLGRLFEQRGIAVRSLKQRDDILSLIQQRVAGGLDTNVELRQGEGALPASRQQIEQLDEQIALGRHTLAALTVQPPNTYDSLVVPLQAVQVVPVPSALPADLLGRRADISAARWRVEAATSDVKNAKASFYPDINLTSFIGLSSIGLNQLLRASSEQYSIGPALSLPIFDGGRLRANLRGRDADLDAAIESYNGTVIDAVHDAADQISSLESIGRQQTQQNSALSAAESAYDLATQRYRAGLGTYLTVLNAEATVLTQRTLGADLKARAIDSQIALVRALGGGYAADAETVSVAR